MIELATLAIFIPTFFLVSATPGMCMTLSMTLGMTVGLRRTFWMMWGELIGVGLVAVAAVAGVAAVMLNYPTVFAVFKYLGGAYLIWLGIQMWRSRGRMALSGNQAGELQVGRLELATQGFVTAIANPKGWAFMIALLPPFLDTTLPMIPQLTILVIIILLTEFLCLVLYATGGNGLRRFLKQSSNVRVLNRVAGSLMIGVGVWLAAG